MSKNLILNLQCILLMKKVYKGRRMNESEKLLLNNERLEGFIATLKEIGGVEENTTDVIDTYYHCVKTGRRLKIRQINKVIFQLVLTKGKTQIERGISADQKLEIARILKNSNGVELVLRLKRTRWMLENWASITIDLVEGLEEFIFIGFDTFLANDDLFACLKERQRIVSVLGFGALQKTDESYYDLICKKRQSEKTVADAIMKSLKHVERREDSFDRKAVTSGFQRLDRLLNGHGFLPSQLTLITGEQSITKMIFAYQVALNASIDMNHVGLVSMSLSKEDVVRQMFCIMADELSLEQLVCGRLTGSQWAALTTAAGRIYDLPLFLHESVDGMIQLAQTVSSDETGERIELLVIDNLEKLGVGIESGRMLLDLKQIARSLNIPLIAVSCLDPREGLPSSYQAIPDLLIDVGESPVRLLSNNVDEKEIIISVRKSISGPVGKIIGKFSFPNLRFSL